MRLRDMLNRVRDWLRGSRRRQIGTVGVGLGILVAVIGLPLYFAVLAGGGGGAERAQSIPTPSPVVSRPTPTPEPTPAPSPSPSDSPSLPAKPSEFQAFPAAIADHLTQAGGSPDCLAELFEAWDMPSDGTTPCVAADLDGDGEDEYVVRLAREFEGRLAGDINIFDDLGLGYEIVFSLAAFDDFADVDLLKPVIFEVRDLNADSRAEAFFTTSVCGAHTCSLTVYVIGHEGGEYIPILDAGGREDGAITLPVTEEQVRLVDVDGDGVAEILLREGLIGSVGAGPQREATRTYRWDGRRYVLAGTEYDPSDLRYFTVRDADDAFANGDYERAITLYREAVDSSQLQDVDYLGNPAELIAYARFRISLAMAVRGDTDGALASLDAAVAADPEALHSQLTARFRQGYAKVRHVSAGCGAARDFVEGNLDAFSALWAYGYANPEFRPEALCP